MLRSMESEAHVSPLDALGPEGIEANVQKLLYGWMLHEIKSPLTTLLMQLHLVQARAQEQHQSLSGVRQCQEEARRLKDLVFQLEGLLLDPFQSSKDVSRPLMVQIDRFFSFIFMQLQENPYRYPISISVPRERVKHPHMHPIVGTHALGQLMKLLQQASQDGVNPCRVIFEQASRQVRMMLQFARPQFLVHLTQLEAEWQGSGLAVKVVQGRLEFDLVSLSWPDAQSGS